MGAATGASVGVATGASVGVLPPHSEHPLQPFHAHLVLQGCPLLGHQDEQLPVGGATGASVGATTGASVGDATGASVGVATGASVGVLPPHAVHPPQFVQVHLVLQGLVLPSHQALQTPPTGGDVGAGTGASVGEATGASVGAPTGVSVGEQYPMSSSTYP